MDSERSRFSLLNPTPLTRAKSSSQPTPETSGSLTMRTRRPMRSDQILVALLTLLLIATTADAQTPPRYRLFDVVIWYATRVDSAEYAPAVRQELAQFSQRVSSYRPRPRPAGLGGERKMVYAARE